MIYSGTGSRSLQNSPRSTKQAILKFLLDEFEELDPEADRVMSGYAEGFDSALVVAARHLSIPVIAAVPTKTYGDYYWRRKSVTGENRIAVFQELLDYATEVVYVMEDIHNSNQLYLDGVHANFVRNAYMVSRANFFYVYNPTSPGTSHCFKLIKEEVDINYCIVDEHIETT